MRTGMLGLILIVLGGAFALSAQSLNVDPGVGDAMRALLVRAPIKIGETERLMTAAALGVYGALLLTVAGRRTARYEMADGARDVVMYDPALVDARPRKRFSDRGRTSIVFGLTTCSLFFGGLALWGALAAIESAAIANGHVRVETNRLTLDHPDGGAIARLFVAEGDRVQKGQVLLNLDDTQLRAEADVLSRRRDTLDTQRFRLIAEQQGEAALIFPDALRKLSETRPSLAEAILLQQDLFDASRDAFLAEIDAREQRSVQLNKRIAGLEAQLAAVRRQSALIAEERADLEALFEKGLTPQSRVLALRRGAADLDGRVGQLEAEIAQIRAGIAEVRLGVVTLRRDRLSQVSEALRETVAEMAELEPRLLALQARLRRTELRAPADGLVFGLRKFTEGGSIRAGEPILDVVPEGQSLIVEAQISPVDRDVIAPGMTARVRFTAFSQRDTQPIEGELVRISADAVEDEAQRTTYYAAVVSVEPALLAAQSIELKPGMPAEVIVPLEARTPPAVFPRTIAGELVARSARGVTAMHGMK